LHTVIETPTFLADAKAANVSEAERFAIVSAIAEVPLSGDVIKGTGGARKVRVGGKGKGKRGAYRVITFFGGDDIPVFLLALVSKSDRSDISQAERNALRLELSTIADNYRKTMVKRQK
jgi:hypothetical protein